MAFTRRGRTVQRKLEGRVALVTGSGRGIGRAIAHKFSREGAKLVINDLDEAPAHDVAAEIMLSGGEAVVCAGNVTAPDFGERLIATAVDRFGAIDIIVNNAGYTWDNVIQKMTDKQWQAILDVHLTAPFRILRAAQPVIRGFVRAEQAEGRTVIRKVINISSVAALYGNAGQSSYSAAKAGIIGLTRTLAKEWGRLNTTVNCVAFGVISTRLAGDVAAGESVNIDGHEIPVGVNSAVLAGMEKRIPLGRAGTPEDAAGAVYLFSIPESDYVSGETLLCSGGLMGM